MICIAIDGPAGSGKSSVSKLVAKNLGFTSIDTGALYRAVAYYLKSNEIPEENIKNALKNIELKAKNIDGKFNVFLSGENVTDKIRGEEISKMTSKNENCVMDGRDIGTVVMPNAEIKIFLTASPETRAMRRFKQLGEAVPFENILEDLKKRDYQDTHREIAPLKMASDAILIDNSDISLEQTVEKICDIARNF